MLEALGDQPVLRQRQRLSLIVACRSLCHHATVADCLRISMSPSSDHKRHPRL